MSKFVEVLLLLFWEAVPLCFWGRNIEEVTYYLFFVFLSAILYMRIGDDKDIVWVRKFRVKHPIISIFATIMSVIIYTFYFLGIYFMVSYENHVVIDLVGVLAGLAGLVVIVAVFLTDFTGWCVDVIKKI